MMFLDKYACICSIYLALIRQPRPLPLPLLRRQLKATSSRTSGDHLQSGHFIYNVNNYDFSRTGAAGLPSNVTSVFKTQCGLNLFEE
jgi:hypothetical protein